MSETTTAAEGSESATAEGQQEQQQEKTYTQAEVDQLIKARADRIAKQQYGDYDELKERAEGAKTLEERLADVESRYKKAEAARMRSDIAAKHGISPEDRDLFLTGTDEEALNAQAERLAARDADRKKQGNTAPKEGTTSTTGNTDQEARNYAKNLFGGANSTS